MPWTVTIAGTAWKRPTGRWYSAEASGSEAPAGIQASYDKDTTDEFNASDGGRKDGVPMAR